jgi:hypothetical protein
MKPINKLAVAALLALSSAGLASAGINVIHVTGSTAYRAADITAETTYLNGITGTGGVKAEYFDTGSSASLNHAAYSCIYGPVPSSGNQTVFENYFNGSVGGDEALVVPVTLGFPSSTTYASSATAVTVGSASAASTGGTAFGNNTGFATDTVAPDIAFSDVFFDTATQIINQSTDTNTLGTPTDNIVGVVPFVFVANGSTDISAKLSGLTMTPQLFTYLWESGTIPLSFFTGVTTDSTSTVYALGRDIDSGTRSTALAETGYGLNGSGNIDVNNGIVQYFPYDNATDGNNDVAAGGDTVTGVIGDSTAAGTVIGAMNFVPEENLDAYEMPTGDGGYYSGGNLATALSATYSGSITKTALMTYLGVSDAKTALTSSVQAAQLMSYNGVTFIPNPTSGQLAANAALIYSGKYSFWGYEHEFYFGSNTAPVGVAALGIKGQLNGGIDVLASAGVTIASMQVYRPDDGEAVNTGNPY